MAKIPVALGLGMLSFLALALGAHAVIYTSPTERGQPVCLFLEDYTQDIRELDGDALSELINAKQSCIDRLDAEGKIKWYVVVLPGRDRLSYQPYEPIRDAATPD